MAWTSSPLLPSSSSLSKTAAAAGALPFFLILRLSPSSSSSSSSSVSVAVVPPSAFLLGARAGVLFIVTSLAGRLFFAPLQAATTSSQFGSYCSSETDIKSAKRVLHRFPRSQDFITFCLEKPRSHSTVLNGSTATAIQRQTMLGPSRAAQPEPPSCYYCCCCCSCYCCCWWRCCWECWRSRRPAPSSRPAATTAAAAAVARATAAAGGGAALSTRGATGAGVARDGEQRSLPLSDDPTPQQLREWVIQRGSPGGGGFGFIWPQQPRDCASRRCVHGRVEAAALGSSESAVAPGAG
ncbi:unnamed protein product [Closterium sp. NIES-54]